MDSRYRLEEVNKSLRDAKVQIWNSSSAISSSREGNQPSARVKYTLRDGDLYLGNEIATVENVKQMFESDIFLQCQDAAVLAKIIGKVLKEEKTFLGTEAQVRDFIPRFQNFMDSLNYVSPAFKNASKLNIEEGNLDLWVLKNHELRRIP